MKASPRLAPSLPAQVRTPLPHAAKLRFSLPRSPLLSALTDCEDEFAIWKAAAGEGKGVTVRQLHVHLKRLQEGACASVSRVLRATGSNRDADELARRMVRLADTVERLTGIPDDAVDDAPRLWGRALAWADECSTWLQELVAKAIRKQVEAPGNAPFEADRAVAGIPKWNDTEKAIIETLGERSMTSDAIARKAGLNNNSYFRQTLSALKKRGVLAHDRNSGFRVAWERE